MEENKTRSLAGIFLRSVASLFVVANLFQLMLARDELTGFSSVVRVIKESLGIASWLTLVAAGFFVLVLVVNKFRGKVIFDHLIFHDPHPRLSNR